MFKTIWQTIIAITLISALPAYSKDYKSSEMITREEFRYGAFEARVRAAQGSGQIVAFFLWKNGSEIDGTEWQEQDFELFGKDGRYQTQIMTPGQNGQPRTENNLYHSLPTNAWENYFTYRMEWTPNYLAFYIDGHLVRRETDPVRFAKLLDPSRTEPAQLRISLWAGDAPWAGALDESQIPASAFVEYLSTYNYTPGSGDNGSDFTLNWRDEFNSINGNRWWFANWTFDSSVTDYIPQNVSAIDGKAVFIMTDNDGVGQFPSIIPADNPPLEPVTNPVGGEGTVDIDAIAIPNRVEAENYSAFFDSTIQNQGDASCSSTAVDAQVTPDTGGGCHIGYIDLGEWLEYKIDVPESGLYIFKVRAASRTTDNRISFTLGEQSLGPVLHAEGLGIDSFSDLTFQAELPSGPQTLRLNFSSVSGLNINYFDILNVDGSGGPVEPEEPEEPEEPSNPEVTGPGAEVLIPARIEAEDFVSGFDSTEEQLGNIACDTGAVDAQLTTDPTGGNCNIAYTQAGEWLQYEVFSEEDAAYQLTLRVASAQSDQSIAVSIDGIQMNSNISIPNNGWQSFSNITIPINLTSGSHTVRVTFQTGSTNLNYLSFATSSDGENPPTDEEPPESYSEGPGTEAVLPALIEAENFVRGFDTTDAQMGSNACGTGAIDAQQTSDPAGGNCNIAWTTEGEWLEYEILAESTGTYEITLRLASSASGRTVTLLLDGEPASGSLVAPSNGWQAFSDVSVPLNLTTGPHTLRVIFETGSTNFNYLSIDHADVTQPPVDEPPVDEPPVDEPPVDEPPVDEPPVDEPPVDEPPVDEPIGCEPYIYEAESISKTTGGLREDAWNIWTNGSINTMHTFGKPYTIIEVSAYGDQAGSESPEMRVSVNGSVIGEIAISNTSFESFYFQVGNITGEAQIEVAFTNDFLSDGADRNLIVDNLKVDECFD